MPDPGGLTPAAARLLAGLGTGRRLLGITGAPGVGKSTLAAAVVAARPGAVLLPMDGFHLAQAELERLGRADRKGAPDTFDAAGFVALLERVRAQRPGDDDVYAPWFDRSLEQPIAGAVAVPATAPLVVVEGNYLLHDVGAWRAVADLLDETWFLDGDEPVRRDRLVARHVAFGKAPAAARDWTLGPDEANALLIARTRHRATHHLPAP